MTQATHDFVGQVMDPARQVDGLALEGRDVRGCLLEDRRRLRTLVLRLMMLVLYLHVPGYCCGVCAGSYNEGGKGSILLFITVPYDLY